jgi:CTP:molybdopterin cytidylyltransferase MocA
MSPGSNGDRHRAPLVVLAAGLATRYGGVKPLAPVGVGGEAVIDVLASDALAAGFGSLLLVVGPETGPTIRYHVERAWPHDVDVRFATQGAPRGTVDAVLAAARHLGTGTSFGVANADDLPDRAGLELLAAHLEGSDARQALVAYRLAASLVGDAPVTRGVCSVGPDGLLRGIDERRRVSPAPDGRVTADDGRAPRHLDPDAPVSMNLWGFRPGILTLFDAAMARGAEGEVLLPEVVGAAVATRAAEEGDAAAPEVLVLRAPGRCIGVTHADDVDLVRAELAREIGRGERPEKLWGTRRSAGAGAVGGA